ncbi:hypothetical protein HVA01_22210 [Halovibrio variabilis]|uniref:Uncharacterized protein n=1 Tax=Halovibrio variabilis TaxID=31910 RepID=A0A511UPP3_9GAMM|nr:hypothetical protein [Halovibrio variabilis]GEN28575.1 hypothetical protein HVA01_22210 [Halovibrio variabilis]
MAPPPAPPEDDFDAAAEEVLEGLALEPEEDELDGEPEEVDEAALGAEELALLALLLGVLEALASAADAPFPRRRERLFLLPP